MAIPLPMLPGVLSSADIIPGGHTVVAGELLHTFKQLVQEDQGLSQEKKTGLLAVLSKPGTFSSKKDLALDFFSTSK